MGAQSDRAVRRDLRFLRWYAYTVKHVMTRYRVGEGASALPTAPTNLLGCVERELAAESRRMRAMLRAMIAVSLMPALLAGSLWSGLYWLPVRIAWFPFERGMYGLPLFSLFEWLAFLSLAAFLAYSAAMLTEGLSSTRRASTEYRRLVAMTPGQQAEIAEEVRTGSFPRAAFLLSRSKPFASFAPLLDAPTQNPGRPE